MPHPVHIGCILGANWVHTRCNLGIVVLWHNIWQLDDLDQALSLAIQLRIAARKQGLLTDHVNVSFDHQTSATITVTDLQGLVLLTETFTGDLFTVSLSGIPAGIYLLKVEYEGHVEARQIVKL